ncbi:MAG: TonB-dependent receptor [Gemmatimonadetes bacterium]|nr:TonB-dependent receptor [Gemmatimonadota bacterium]
MKLGRWTGVLSMVLACGVGGAGLSAQTTTGSIIGVIHTQEGTAAGTQVTVRNAATGFTRSVIASEAGRYIIPGLETGTYEVTTTSIGFGAQTKTATVALGQATRVDFNLTTQAVQLGGITVTSTSAMALISPSRTGVLTTISDSALHRLPSLNRNFTDFVVLTPQVSTTLPNGGLSGGGVNNRYNQVQVDGTNETDLFGLGSTGQPGGQADGKSIGIEAVKQYQVLLAPFDVRMGNFAGLLINAVTKSGTNEWHGSAYGYGRNQDFARGQEYINNFSQYQYGFTLGGPVVRDKALIFGNVELQRYATPAQGIYLGEAGYNVSPADVNAATAALAGYGVPTGSAGAVTLHNPLTNIFLRMDFPDLPHNSSLTLRYNYGHAVNEALSRGSTGNAPALALTSNQYQYASTKNAPALELRTNFKSGAYNELRASWTRVRDPRTSASGITAPQVTVDIPGAAVVAGEERYSQGNEVDQDIWELVDNVTLPFGTHTVVIGTQNEFYKVRNLYAQSSNGVWTFQSVDSLTNGQAYQYIVGVPAPGTGDGSVRFRTNTLAAYAQDQWEVTPDFTLTYGLRFDVPMFLNKPPTNPEILTDFGRNTANIPSAHLQWSPRVGFNWDVTHDQRNQLRGGIGAFVGHPAYVWMSNAFQNSGLTGVRLLSCYSGNTPAFSSAAVQTPPTACANGVTAAAGSEIDLLQSSLRMPQTLRMSVGYDRDLGHNFIGTVEGLYTKGLYSPFYYNLALAGPQATDSHGRVLYGLYPYSPVLKVPSREFVIDVGNQSKNHFYNLTAKVTRRFADRWEGMAAYTYSRGYDVQSFTSSTAYSQYRYGRVWAGNQLDQTATRSSFEQRHRIVAQASYTFPTNTTVSAIYTGASGIPYNFVYNTDMNGDGLSYNDPIYVPRDATDPNEILFQDFTSDGVTHTAAQQAAEFNQFIDSNSCLKKERGKIMARNVCTAPWTNLVNVSVRQSLRTINMQHVSVQLDVFNFLNLLNPSWGRQGSTYSDVSLLSYRGRSVSGGTLANSQPVFNFDPSTTTIVDFKNLASNYQLQLSLRYSF